MSNEIQRRSLKGAELRAEASDSKYLLVGRACTYGALSQPNIPAKGMREKIMAGCFRSSLQRGDTVFALLNHNPDLPLGKLGAGLTLDDDERGLSFRIQLNPAVQMHRDIYELTRQGVIDCCSFGFLPEDDDVVSDDSEGQRFMVRRVKRARLVDVSVLSTLPAYGGDATSVSARAADYVDDWRPAMRSRLSTMQADWKRDEKAHEIRLQVIADQNKG